LANLCPTPWFCALKIHIKKKQYHFFALHFRIISVNFEVNFSNKPTLHQ